MMIVNLARYNKITRKHFLRKLADVEDSSNEGNDVHQNNLGHEDLKITSIQQQNL